MDDLTPVIAAIAGASTAGVFSVFIMKRQHRNQLSQDNEVERQTIRDVGKFVLPHFEPPKPGEPDFTVPSQLRENRAATQAVGVDVAELRVELVSHMGNEDALRAADLKDREARQEDLDIRLEAGTTQFRDLNIKLDEVHSDVKGVMTRLGEGNPELRQDV